MDTKGKVTTYLVIDSETDTESVCKFACELGNADTIIDTVFCKELLYAFEDEVCSWPPTTHTLCTLTNQNKSLLNKFLSILISGRKKNLVIPKMNVLSVLLAKIYFEPRPMPMDDGSCQSTFCF
jgi:hypothetical protein